MSAATVADVYASAALAAAGESGRAGIVADAQALVNAFAEQPETVALLDHPALNRDQAKALISSVFADKLQSLTVSLLQLLVDRGRLAELPSILAAIVEHDAAANGQQHASVSSAAALSDAEQSRISEVLRQASPTGLVDIDWTVDASLIGGVQIQVGEVLVDGSVARRLRQAVDMIHAAPASGHWQG